MDPEFMLLGMTFCVAAAGGVFGGVTVLIGYKVIQALRRAA